MRRIVLHSRREVLRTLFVRAWYLPLALATLIFAANWSLTPHSSLLHRTALNPHATEAGKSSLNPLALGSQDFQIEPSNDPHWQLRQVSFDYTPLPHSSLLLRFDETGRRFEFVRISGSPEFPSGVFRFDEGRIEPLIEFEHNGLKRSGRFNIGWDGRALSVVQDDRELANLKRDRPLGATSLMLQAGHPLALPLPIDDLRVVLLGPSGERRELCDRPTAYALALILLRTALVLLPLLLLISAILRQLCPPRWLDQHPHRSVAGFGAFGVLLSLLLAVTLVLPLNKRFSLSGDWYSEFMEWGNINEERIEDKSTIYNGVPIPLHPGRERRIVVMGGSSTFGDPFDPSRPWVYPKRLETLYDQCLGGPAGQVEVVNLGSPGDSLERNILLTYEHVVLNHMQPDVVIINSVVNNYISTKKLLNVFHSFLLRARGVRPSAERGDATRFRADLEQVIALAEERDVRLLFVEEPINPDYFYGVNIIADFQQAQAEVCAAHGLPLVRVQDEFTRRRDQFLFFDWAHLTWWGNDLLARLIFAELQRTDMLRLGPCPAAGPPAAAQVQPSSD